MRVVQEECHQCEPDISMTSGRVLFRRRLSSTVSGVLRCRRATATSASVAGATWRSVRGVSVALLVRLWIQRLIFEAMSVRERRTGLRAVAGEDDDSSSCLIALAAGATSASFPWELCISPSLSRAESMAESSGLAISVQPATRVKQEEEKIQEKLLPLPITFLNTDRFVVTLRP